MKYLVIYNKRYELPLGQGCSYTICEMIPFDDLKEAAKYADQNKGHLLKLVEVKYEEMLEE